jgi:hypothetical protein
MTTPTPNDGNRTSKGPQQPMSLEESALALAELHKQMQALNVRLEYLSLLLKLGVR